MVLFELFVYPKINDARSSVQGVHTLLSLLRKQITQQKATPSDQYMHTNCNILVVPL